MDALDESCPGLQVRISVRSVRPFLQNCLKNAVNLACTTETPSHYVVLKQSKPLFTSSQSVFICIKKVPSTFAYVWWLIHLTKFNMPKSLCYSEDTKHHRRCCYLTHPSEEPHTSRFPKPIRSSRIRRRLFRSFPSMSQERISCSIDDILWICRSPYRWVRAKNSRHFKQSSYLTPRMTTWVASWCPFPCSHRAIRMRETEIRSGMISTFLARMLLHNCKLNVRTDNILKIATSKLTPGDSIVALTSRFTCYAYWSSGVDGDTR